MSPGSLDPELKFPCLTRLTRALFALIQVMYLAFYLVASSSCRS